MYEGKKVLAMIPARGRNDGIPHMNMRLLGGKPLIYYTIKAAKACDWIDKIVVSTEDAGIAEYVVSQGVEVPFLRNPDLAGDTVVMETIIEELLAHYGQQGMRYDILLNLYPNAPFKSKELLLQFTRKAVDDDMVIPLHAHQNYFWSTQAGSAQLFMDATRTTRKQAMKKYEELGGIYAHNLSRGRWKESDAERIGYCELDFHDSRMVNSVYDMIMLERLIRLPKSLIDDLLKSE